MAAPSPISAPGLSGVRALAAALSVAVRVEPELIRAVRLSKFPSLDVGCEADLWFSDVVHAREPRSIVFDDAARNELHAVLGEMLREAAPDDPIRDLWDDVISKVHAHISPVLWIEEYITWLAVSQGVGAEAKIEEELQPALDALIREDRTGIADWFAGAFTRLPDVVRRTPIASQLLAASLPVARLAVQRDGAMLEFGSATPADDAVAILVPDTEPRVVEIATGTESAEWRSLTIPVGQSVQTTVGYDTVRIRTARGDIYALAGIERQGAGACIFLSQSRADNAQAVGLRDWLAQQGWDDVFLDLDPEGGIAASGRWERALRESASRCEAVLFLVSRAWLDSRWCLKELALADNLNKRLFAVLIEEFEPAELPTDLSKTWQIVDLASGRDHLQFRVTLPRTQEERHVTFSKEGLARLRAQLVKAGLDPRFFEWPPNNDPHREPYRGWAPFEAADAGVFFGRHAQMVSALDELRSMQRTGHKTMFVVLGPSGCGKSSFLRAGLLPRLQRDDRRFAVLDVVRPERRSLTGDSGLAQAIHTARRQVGLEQPAPGAIKDMCRADPAGVRALLKEFQNAWASRALIDGPDVAPPTVMLPIDQAEELFSPDADPEAEQFLHLLSALARPDTGDQRADLIVLATIRASRYEAMRSTPALSGIDTVLFNDLHEFPPTALAEIITGPARRWSEGGRPLRIEAALVDTLLQDFDGSWAAAPLLSQMLNRLFTDYGSTGELKVAHYHNLGGLGHLVQLLFDEVLSSDPRRRQEQLDTLRGAFIPWLVMIDPDSQRPARRVAHYAELPEASWSLIDALINRRLLVADERQGHTVVEIATDSVLRNWNELTGWLHESRQPPSPPHESETPRRPFRVPRNGLRPGADSSTIEADADILERAAKDFHEHWASAAGREHPATLPWNKLSEFYRGVARRQVANTMWTVEHIAGHTWTVGDPEPDPLASQLHGVQPLEQLRMLGFPEDVCYEMARAEHENWSHYLRQHGWRYGPVRDEALKRHEKLVPWEQVTADPDLLRIALKSIAGTLIQLRAQGFRSRPLWGRYHRVGTVTARRHRLRWTWTGPSGERRRASAREWEVCADGQCWPVADDVFRRSFRNIADDQWERTSIVLARRAGDGETIDTPDGVVTTQDGDWVVQGESGEYWRVTDEEFSHRYRAQQ
jgi:hypothetical protein